MCIRKRKQFIHLLLIGFCSCLLSLFSIQDTARAEWPSDDSAPLPICNAVGSQYGPKLLRVADGYIVAWQDERRVFRDIYIQKFDVNGNIKWMENGRTVAAGNNGDASNHLLYNSQSLTGLVSDAQGGAIVLWTEDYGCSSGPCGNAWITRVHSNSDVRWGMAPSPGVTIQGTDTAVLLNTHGHADAIAPDGEDGAFGIVDVDPWGSWYVFRIDGNGMYRSVTSGAVDARGASSMVYNGSSSGKDYVSIAWWNYGDYAINVKDPESNYPASGDTLFAPWSRITLSSTPAWWSEPAVVPDGAGGMIVVWEDSRNGNSDIYAQRISAEGSTQWTSGGVPIAVQPATQRRPQLVSDGAGGAVMVWEDFRASPARVYAQHIGADGVPRWDNNGIPASSTTGGYPKIIRSYDGAYIVAWFDTDSNGGTKDYLRAQKIDPAGSLLWPSDSRTPSGGTTGVVVSEIYAADFDIASDGGRGLIAVWELGGDIYAKRVAPAISENPLDTVQKIYIGYYQRPADPGGLLYWAGRLAERNGNLNEIIEAYANSAESQALYGIINSSNISEVVDSIYLALFNRPAEPEGKAYYADGFHAGRFTAATIMLDVLNGAQNEDLLSVSNKLAAANLFTRTIDPELDGSNFQITYAGEGDATKARAFLGSVTSDTSTIPTQIAITTWMNSNIVDPEDPITTSLSVYKGVGSVQCYGGGTSLEDTEHQLADAGIQVLSSGCGYTGLLYPAVCGGADGKIYIFQIPVGEQQVAISLGFGLLSDLPEARASACQQ